jgi:hypothetical protein
LRFTKRRGIQAACKTMQMNITGLPSGSILTGNTLKEPHR